LIPWLLYTFIPFLIHIPLLSYGLQYWYMSQTGAPLRRYFAAGVGVKCTAGIMLGMLYLYVYPYRGDTWLLFDESAVLSRTAFFDPLTYAKALFLNDAGAVPLSLAGQPRALFMAKLLSVLNVFTFHNYWITGLYCSLFSFWGMWRLGNELANRYPQTRHAAAIAFLFFPSAVFWSSGILKETIALGCMGVGLATLLPVMARYADSNRMPGANSSQWRLVTIMIIVWLLWQLKFYYLGALSPAVLSLWAAVIVHRHGLVTHSRVLRFLQILFFVAIVSLGCVGVPMLSGQSLLADIVANHDATVRISQPGTYVAFGSLQPEFSGFLRHFPLALWSGLFAPLAWQARNILALWVSIENSFLLVGCIGYLILALGRTQGSGYLGNTVFTRLLIQSAWLYIGLLAVVLVYASPNFGTLARYKVGFLPFLVYILWCKIASVVMPKPAIAR